MDKKKSILNITIAIGFKAFLLVLSLLTRRYLVKLIGNEANGLNSLYLSIIGILSIAELGIGSAIIFSMYEPIAKGDYPKISALYSLFTKIYRIIGLIILVAGLCVIPLLPYLAKDYSSNFNLSITFLLMLISVVLSYTFSAKTSLIEAYKNNYIVTIITSSALVLQQALQIGSLFLFKSFEAYLICRIIGIVFQWIVTSIYTNRKYKDIISLKATIDDESKAKVMKNTKAMFMHKIGGLLVNTADSIIISAFIGVVVLGKYSNYVTIMTSMTSILTLFFTPLTAILGHLCVSHNVEEEEKYFKFFYGFNFIIGTIAFLGYYACIDNVISILFGGELVIDKTISFVITLNYFIQFMRQTGLLFRDATGTFYNDRWKPLIEGTLNIVLSIVFVYFFDVVGVIVATIITNIFICHIIEPLVIYKHEFEKSPKNYYLYNYTCIILFFLLLIVVNYSHISVGNQWLSILINGCIAVAIGITSFIFTVIVNKNFKDYFLKMSKKIISILKRKSKNIQEMRGD